ncbi:GntR family transcriptional regulator [Nocardiopsis alba]|jgi:DNA-binding GntR family transcriptional regulator|uniref:GntR family transcriptional regulator n=1 Tax=Nocardiopsis alba TaxID=53437 RepID=UPI0033BCF7A4
MTRTSGGSAPLTRATEAAIREGIISGRYAPGARLRERELSEELGVSRLPVREALRNLRHDGFIMTSAHKGATVRTMSADDVDELFDLRTRLEPFAAERAARRYAEGYVHEGLTAAMEATAEATESGSLEHIMTANADFHASVVEAAGHGLLSELMAPVLSRSRWLFAMTAFRDPHLEFQAHHEIYHAISHGNDRLARLTMAAHIEAGRGPSLLAVGADAAVDDGRAAPPPREPGTG